MLGLGAPNPTPRALRDFNRLQPADAVVRAWTDAGANPNWHRRQVAEVRRRMPLLAHSLDRLAREQVKNGD